MDTATGSSGFADLPRPELELDPDGTSVADFYSYADLLTEHETAALRRLRAHLATEVAPRVEGAWERAEFPPELVKGFAGLDLAGAPYGLGEGFDEPCRRL